MSWGEPHLVLSLESAQGSGRGALSPCSREDRAGPLGTWERCLLQGPGQHRPGGRVPRCLAVTGGVWFLPEGERVINSR